MQLCLKLQCSSISNVVTLWTKYLTFFPSKLCTIAFGDFMKTEISSDKESAVQNERIAPEHVDEGIERILMTS